MAAEELPEALIAARAEARELRQRYEQQGKFPLVWVARERFLTEAGTRRHRFVVKTFMRTPEKQRMVGFCRAEEAAID